MVRRYLIPELGKKRLGKLGARDVRMFIDVDLDASALEVVHALQRVGRELGFVQLKTDDSQRTIPLPTICVDAIKLRKERQKAEWADAWPNWKDNDLVFPSRVCTPLEPDNLRRSWGRIRKAAGLGDVRFHDIRHTCVSLLLDLGVPPHIVRDIVGHSDIDVTMTINDSSAFCATQRSPAGTV